jgi:phosphoribosylamine--glycine ligase
MKIVVVGSGGREHALAWRLACGAGDAPRRDRDVVVVPGNAGIARFFRTAQARTVADVVEVVAQERADLVVVGPESWLALGLVDELRERGVPCFGPEAAAARLETSKAFMKSVAQAAGVPTADAVVVRSVDEAHEFLRSRAGRGVVVKASGLCAGKGVVVCADVEAARQELAAMLGEGPGATGPRFGEASSVVVVEDMLQGQELSVFAVCDGEDAVILGAARDHKRLFDDDRGPNTGGMGAVAPLGPESGVTEEFLEDIRRRFFLPTLQEMVRRGAPFRGVLFAGLMVNDDGTSSLLEFNVRLGDPETEALLFALDLDLAPIFSSVASFERLSQARQEHRHEAIEHVISRARSSSSSHGHAKAATVVVAAPGYPEAPELGLPLTGVMAAERVFDVKVFFAGVAAGGFGLVVDGGRVLAITGRGPTFDVALERAYRAVDHLGGLEQLQVRRDIGRSVRTAPPPELMLRGS